MAKVRKSENQSAKAVATDKPETTRKTRVFQADIPRHTVHEALRFAEAIADNYAKAPTKPLHLAAAVEMTVNSGHFRMLLGASAAYGLTTGAWDSPTVALTALGKRVVEAKADAEKRLALKEAFLKPRVIGAFLSKYANAKLPKDNIAKHILEELGVPTDSADQALQLIIKGASELGLLRDMKGNLYVDMDSAPNCLPHSGDYAAEADEENEYDPNWRPKSEVIEIAPSKPLQPAIANNRVFITHGKNVGIVTQLKELLTFGSFLPVVAAEHETISKPVPDKVMDDMRSCSAAIIHVGKEIKLLDQEGREHVFVNQNVLIEIGAAMALYGRKFILLVERGANLPSNLQGLYEVRYDGDKLDYEATMKLLKAFSDFRQ